MADRVDRDETYQEFLRRAISYPLPLPEEWNLPRNAGRECGATVAGESNCCAFRAVAAALIVHAGLRRDPTTFTEQLRDEIPTDAGYGRMRSDQVMERVATQYQVMVVLANRTHVRVFLPPGEPHAIIGVVNQSNVHFQRLATEWLQPLRRYIHHWYQQMHLFSQRVDRDFPWDGAGRRWEETIRLLEEEMNPAPPSSSDDEDSYEEVDEELEQAIRASLKEEQERRDAEMARQLAEQERRDAELARRLAEADREPATVPRRDQERRIAELERALAAERRRNRELERRIAARVPQDHRDRRRGGPVELGVLGAFWYDPTNRQ